MTGRVVKFLPGDWSSSKVPTLVTGQVVKFYLVTGQVVKVPTGDWSSSKVPTWWLVKCSVDADDDNECDDNKEEQNDKEEETSLQLTPCSPPGRLLPWLHMADRQTESE